MCNLYCVYLCKTVLCKIQIVLNKSISFHFTFNFSFPSFSTWCSFIFHLFIVDISFLVTSSCLLFLSSRFFTNHSSYTFCLNILCLWSCFHSLFLSVVSWYNWGRGLTQPDLNHINEVIFSASPQPHLGCNNLYFIFIFSLLTILPTSTQVFTF